MRIGGVIDLADGWADGGGQASGDSDNRTSYWLSCRAYRARKWERYLHPRSWTSCVQTGIREKVLFPL